MEKKQTIIFNRLEIADKPSVEQVASVMCKNSYDETEGLGFTNVNVIDGIIYAQVLFRTPSYVQSYNEEDGLLEQQIINVYTELEIVLDIEQGFLYASTPAVKFNKAKVLLRKSFDGKIVFRNIDVTPKKLWNQIKHTSRCVQITDLSIKKYIYKEGAMGRLMVHLEDPLLGEELLRKYSEGINKITMSIVGECGENFVLSVTSQNTFSLKCKEECEELVINQLKKYL